jgi:hypothetical protein
MILIYCIQLISLHYCFILLIRMEDPNKRLPLHHMLNGLNYLSNTSQPYIVFLKQLLAAFPQSAFCHVSEEIRSIRIQPMTTTLVERTETINSTGNGERNYHFVTEKVTWTAIEKSRDYHHPQVRSKRSFPSCMNFTSLLSPLFLH